MPDKITIERIQSGVRIEKRILKVLKGLAEYLDLSLSDLLEGIILHAFDNNLTFSDTICQKINELKKVYDLELDSSHSHKLIESTEID